MRRIAAFLTVCCLMLCFYGAPAQDEDDSWVVVEEEYTADVRYQAGVLMRHMTLREKICQMMFLCPENLTGESYTTRWPEGGALAGCPAGGILLFGQNIVSETQLDELTADILRDAENAPFPPFLAVEEEGGAVSRIANKLGLSMQPSPKELGESGQVENAARAGREIGAYLSRFRINLDFAPNADVLTEPQNELGSRCFGSDADTVSRMALAFMSGLKESGVSACYQHFPGQGNATGKVYRGTARSKRTLEELMHCELIPFTDGIAAGVPMILVSHMTARGLDEAKNASLSYTVMTGLLRNTLGFPGVIITESMRGKAFRGERKAGDLAVDCVLAGADMLLLPEDAEDVVRGLTEAVEKGILTEQRINESVERILMMKIGMGLIR